METVHSERRLAAIMMADIVGYSKLMAADQGATIKALRQLRSTLFNPIVDQHRGNVVKSMGDGWLVEFPSISDAVTCAIAIQIGLEGQDTIRLRVGIRTGEVFIDADDVFGEGVNVAARLDALAEAGQVLTSDTAMNSLDRKTAAQFQGGAPKELKNIARPIAVWCWPDVGRFDRPMGSQTASASHIPAIAVLAFDNLSGDPEQAYFSDGITEDIITDLSKVGSLRVVSRNSSFTFKGCRPDARVVGGERETQAGLLGLRQSPSGFPCERIRGCVCHAF